MDSVSLRSCIRVRVDRQISLQSLIPDTATIEPFVGVQQIGSWRRYLLLGPISYIQFRYCILLEYSLQYRDIRQIKMAVRKRGDVKQANGSANGSANGTTNGTIEQHDDVELKTDHMRWRMKDVDGRQTWHYLESDEQLKAWPMTSADKYYLGMDTVRHIGIFLSWNLHSDDSTRAHKHSRSPQLLFKQPRMG